MTYGGEWITHKLAIQEFAVTKFHQLFSEEPVFFPLGWRI